MVTENKNNTHNTAGGRVIVGEVISDKMEKTVVVKTTRSLKHPVYGKVVRLHKKYKVHDEANAAKTGDLVEITESRPLSKTKHMTLVRVLPKH